MSNLREKTELLLYILQKLPCSRDITDVRLDRKGQGIDFSWSCVSERIPSASFRAEKGLNVQVLQMMEDVARKTALAFFVEQTINRQSEPVNQMAIPAAWPADLINAATLARLMRNDVQTRLQNGESVDMLIVFDRLITLFEQFEL